MSRLRCGINARAVSACNNIADCPLNINLNLPVDFQTTEDGSGPHMTPIVA